MGIRQISGDLIVTDNFAMNYSNSAKRSADTLYATMDSTKRSATATRVWLAFLRNSGKYSTVAGVPDITIAGAALRTAYPEQSPFIVHPSIDKTPRYR